MAIVSSDSGTKLLAVDMPGIESSYLLRVLLGIERIQIQPIETDDRPKPRTKSYLAVRGHPILREPFAASSYWKQANIEHNQSCIRKATCYDRQDELTDS